MRKEALPLDSSIDLDARLFNDVFYPHLMTIHNYEVYYGGAASGKCFAKGTKVVMFSGELKAVEDIVVGDLLMGPDSKPRKVLNLSQGIGQLYKVHQNKGMDYVVNENHILCLKRSIGCDGKPGKKRRYPSDSPYIEISVKDYLDKSIRWKRNFMGYRATIDFDYKKVDLDPYFLGVWLGDGSSGTTHVTTEDVEVVSFLQNYADKLRTTLSVAAIKGKAKTYSFLSMPHPFYIREAWANIIANISFTGWSKNISYSKICRETGFSRKNIAFWMGQPDFVDRVEYYKKNLQPIDTEVIKTYSHSLSLLQRMDKYNIRGNKHIPDDYLYNSREVRLQVLAGLIDTDGHSTRNCYDMVQKNKTIAYQIKYLCNSLGLRCSIYQVQKTCVNNGVVGTYYRSSISGNLTEVPVKIERKKIKTCGIVDPVVSGIIVSEDQFGEYYGFEIDGDHKFLLEDFTVTHNSTFVGQKLALQLTVFPGRNLVCIRKQKKDCIKSCWGEIYNALTTFKLRRYWEIRTNPEHVMINRVNGNEILFEGLDDVEDIKSIKFTKKNEDSPGDSNITDIWYEEVNAEDNEDNVDQLDIRLRDPFLKNRLIISFNPVSRSHFLYNLVTTKWNMPGVDSLILKTTYKDNRFCKAETAAKYERYKYTNPYMYQVYTLGNWGTMGETIFDSAVVGKRLADLQEEHLNKPPVVGDFAFKEDKRGIPVPDTYSFMPIKGGATKIFKMPESKHPYVIAVDTAGEGNGDYYAGHVRDNYTQEQVATFHSKSGISYCVYQIYCLACFYNEALVCFESNFDQTPIKLFLLMDYTNMYRATTPADKTHQHREDRYGFRTTSGNRLTMISQLITWVNANTHLINDVDTLNEMLVFTRQDKKLKGIWMGAEPGEHDDLVISYGILLQASEQQYMELVPTKKKLEGSWMREDLDNAVKEGRVDRLAALEYARTKSFFGEEEEMPKLRQGSTRYARHR